MKFHIDRTTVLVGLLLAAIFFPAVGSAYADPTVSAGNTTVVAGPSGTQHALFPVTLSGLSNNPVSVSYSTANGTATAGTDYTATNGTLTIPAGDLAGGISVPVAGGQTDGSGLTFSLTLAKPTNAVIGLATGTASIIHDAAPVAVSVTPSQLENQVNFPGVATTTYSSVGGASNFAGINLCIGSLSSPATSVYAKYLPTTGLFYLANAAGAYVGGFAAGSPHTITTGLGTLNLAATTVTASGNQLVVGWDFTPAASFAGYRNIYLSATDSFGLGSGWQNLGIWRILAPPVASVANTTVLTGLNGTQFASFLVTAIPGPMEPVTFGYSTSNGTATAGIDYTASQGTVTIPSGGSTAVITVPVAGGQSDASGLTFTVTLSNPLNSTIGTATGTCVINHDVAPTSVSVSPSAATGMVGVPELLTATYGSAAGAGNIAVASLNLGKLSSPATSIYAKYLPATRLFYLANASGTYIGGFAAGTANTITTTMGTLNLESTTVTEAGNQLIIGWDFTPAPSLVGSQNVYLAATDNFGATSGWQNLGTWTIPAPSVASIGNTAVLAGPAGIQHALFPVFVTPVSPVPVTVTYATANGTATADTDYTATSGALTIPAGSSYGTISVPVMGGQTDASGLTFEVTISNPVSATIGTATNEAVITHDTSPTAGNLTPNPLTSTVGVPELLTATYASVGGAENLATLGLNAGQLSSPATSLYAKYSVGTGLFYLANASGTYIGGYPAGSANTITTALGTLNLASTTVRQSAGGIFIGWDITPASGLAGSQLVSLDATDDFGLASGWQKLATWNIVGPPTLAIDNTTVTVGSSGTEQALFTVVSTPPPSQPVTVDYATSDGTARAGSDYTSTAGTLTIPAGSSKGSISVPVSGGQTDASGLTFTVTLSNPLNAIVAVASGTATIVHVVPPTVVSVSPNPASSPVTVPLTLTATYSSVGGAANIAAAGLSLGNLASPATSLYAKYVASTGLFYLANSSGTYLGGNAAGSANTITTALGSLNLAATTVTQNGDDLVIGWNFTPAPSFSGVRSVYLVASDAFGLSSGWQEAGIWTIASGPSNDDFADAAAIAGASGSAVSTTVGATLENGEPSPYGDSNTVWYLYTAPASGPGMASFTLSDANLATAVYTGTALPNLTGVAEGGSTVSFFTAPGAPYYLQVQSPSATAGEFNLSWNWINSPANDNFANAQSLSGFSGTVSGTTIAATAQTGEPNAGPSVWYRWTAPTGLTGQVTFVPASSGDAISLAAYTGTSVTGLTSAASATNGASLVFTPGVGTTYFIQAENYGSAEVPFTLTWSWLAFPANDNFGNAQGLPGVSGSVEGTTVGATSQLNEPNPGSTVWYSWVAPAGAPGNVTFVPLGSSDTVSLDAFSGSSQSGLTSVAAGTNNADISFAAVAGGTYYIQAENTNAAQTTFSLSWSWAPGNDDFAAAQAISGTSGSIGGTTLGATLEVGEPYLTTSSGNNVVECTQTVWYAYSATATGYITLSCSDSRVYVQVFQGSAVNKLTYLAYYPQTTGLVVDAGQTYLIQISAYPTPGPFVLSWNWSAPTVPANDDFANAQAISGVSGSVPGSLAFSTIEPNEPNSFGFGSVWYVYTAPASSAGAVTFSPQNMSVSPYILAYTGSAIGSLSEDYGDSDDTNITIDTTAATTYYIQVQSESPGGSPFTLHWIWSPSGPPANDDFANAQSISGVSGSVSGSTTGATVQPAEANGGNASVWYRYTAPSTGPGDVAFTINGYVGYEEGLNLYAGSTLNALTKLSPDNEWSWSFLVDPGETYYIQVDDNFSYTSNFNLNWNFTAAASNDNFANAQAISGPNGSVNGSTVGATIESGEPNVEGTSSVWYLYTAPSSGPGQVTIFATGLPLYSYYLYVYAGNSFGTLNAVSHPDDTSPLFAVTPGMTYYIQVQSLSSGMSAFNLNWSFAPAPPNDNFANAQAISGALGCIAGTDVGGTAEAGEPDLQGQSSVWYAYTAPATGSATFTLSSLSGAYSVEAYSGSSLATLDPLNGGPGDQVTLAVTAASIYYFQVQSEDASAGPFTLQWSVTGGATSASAPGDSSTVETLPAAKRSGHSA